MTVTLIWGAIYIFLYFWAKYDSNIIEKRSLQKLLKQTTTMIYGNNIVLDEQNSN